MANETPISIVGNTTGDVEMRYTQSGTPVANVTVASTPRVFDKQTGEWRDGVTAFWPCTVWGEPAGNVVESLPKGTRVVVSGVIETQEWDHKATGLKRSRQTIRVDEIGPSLRYATAKVTRGDRGDQAPRQQPAGSGWGQQDTQTNQWGGVDDAAVTDPPF